MLKSYHGQLLSQHCNHNPSPQLCPSTQLDHHGGIAIITAANGGNSLITYDAVRSQEKTHRFSNLPNNFDGFDDVAVDPNALARDSTVVFAIDAESGIVCSFDLSFRFRRQNKTNNRNRVSDVSLNLIGCTTQSVNTSPFVGIAAMGGTLVVSGGTGGASVFSYNTNTGVLSNRTTIRNEDLGDVGHPDVTMVTRNIAALSTDAQRGFGILVSNINMNSRSLDRTRFFRVQNTVGFDYAIRPANFPCDSSMYFRKGGRNLLYVANGPITVQDPRRDGWPTVVKTAPDGFEALAVDVSSERSVAVFGGVIDDGESSAYVVLDISDPLAPSFVNMQVVGKNGRNGSGRITGVASAGRNVIYVVDGSSKIGHDRLQSLANSDEGFIQGIA